MTKIAGSLAAAALLLLAASAARAAQPDYGPVFPEAFPGPQEYRLLPGEYPAAGVPAGPAWDARPVLPGVAAAPSACCAPKIVYRHHRRTLRTCCDSCLPPVDLLLPVKNPASCCVTEVKVCLPACCLDAPPKVRNRSGLFGRQIVEYEWCCGYRVRVTFRPRGDVLVQSWGP